MDKHPLAGKTVRLQLQGKDAFGIDGKEYRIEDYWRNVAGRSWMDGVGNPACIQYAMRSGFADLPTDDNVLYGKVGGLGYLVHESELGPEVV